jgi:hypothetical protein
MRLFLRVFAVSSACCVLALPVAAKDVCQAIATQANAGKLGDWIRDAVKGIVYQGRRIDLEFAEQGTAHMPVMLGFDATTRQELDYAALPGLPSAENGIGGGDHLGMVIYQGRHHILHYLDLAHPVATVSLDGGQTCRFNVVTKEKPGSHAKDPALCAALLKENGPPSLPFRKTEAMMTYEQVSETWYQTSMEGMRELDIANDGQRVNVAQLEMSSTAGPGCEAVFYETVNQQGTRFMPDPKRDVLMKLQGADASDRYLIRPCANKPRFFIHKRRIHFETKPWSWPPINTWNQYHRVTAVIDGQVKEVCGFTFESTVSVAKRMAD